jgi:hypothetical protein
MSLIVSILRILITIVISLFFVACGSPDFLRSTLFQHFDDHFSDISFPEKEQLRNASIKKNISGTYDDVWYNTLSILVQYAIIAKVSKDSAMLVFIEIDGVLLEDRYSFVDFPFAVLIEEKSQGCLVYIYPLVGFFEGKISEKSLNIIKIAFTQKSEMFLHRLETQIEANHRWLWLKEATEGESNLPKGY